MIKNIKIFLIFLIFVLAAGFTFYKVSAWQKHQQQLDLGRELRKAISATMLDLSQAKSGSIQGVPPDGQWHHAASFNTYEYGQISYTFKDRQLIRQDPKGQQVIANHVHEFNLRRTPSDPMIVDVKVVLKDGILIPQNFRVRLRE